MATGFASPVGGGLVSGSAPVNFGSAAPSTRVDSNLVIEWDFDNDGDFDQAIEKVTGYVMAAESLTGRDWPSNIHGMATAGQLRLTLVNDDDRFSYFNAGSPLNQGANSLRVGRKIRVRTAESVVSDPVLLARDRFTRADGPLLGSADELGNAWSTYLGGGFNVRGGHIQPAVIDPSALANVATVNVAVGPQYVQARVLAKGVVGLTGVVARAQAGPSYVTVRINNSGAVELIEVVAGVGAILDTYTLTTWANITIGLYVTGTTATAYVNGVPVMSATTSVAAAAGVGVRGTWVSAVNTPPVLDDFYAWTGPVSTVPGVIWTGDISEVNTSVPVAGLKVAEVVATGVLARAAAAQVTAPRVVSGAPTGVLIGDVFTRAGLLLPPGDQIDTGSVTTGPVYLDDGDALSTARQFEATELGFIYEQAEGPPAYQDRAARDGAFSTGWWSDTPGVGQYPYSAITPLDYKREVVNRVTAGVTADAPSGVTLTVRQNSTAAGVANHVDVVMPTVNAGDLLAVFIASSVAAAGQTWLTPIWWFNQRDAGSDVRMRIYDHPCDGSEAGATYRFYTDGTNAGGAWVAHVYRITGWYANGKGIEFVQPTPGKIPPAAVPSWGKFPTLYLAAYAGLTSISGGTMSPTDAPTGYGPTLTATMQNGTVDGFDVGLATAYKIDIGGPEQPDSFTGPGGFVIEESAMWTVRGFNGPFTAPVSIEKPEVFGGEGRTITVDDTPSQANHNAVLSYSAAGNLFRSEYEAGVYADKVIDRYGDDRPIISLSFYATSSAQMREQAYSRRVGDKITVTATGVTGLGFQQDFFIEAIGHRWTDAAKLWEVTWQLSPA